MALVRSLTFSLWTLLSNTFVKNIQLILSNHLIEFLEKVQEDSNLQAELAKAMEAEDDRTEVTKLANSKGSEISSDELWAEVQKRQADFEKRKGNGELSDEELEAVSGGTAPTMFPTPFGPIIFSQLPNQPWNFAPAKW